MSIRKRLEPMREVCTRHSGRIAIHGNSIVASGGSTPTIVAVPRIAKALDRLRQSFALPTASRHGRPRRRRSARAPPSTGIVLGRVDEMRGPTSNAISRFDSNWSTAMIWARAAIRAPWTIERPTRRSHRPRRSGRLRPRAGATRADPGQHAATDQRRLVERDFGVDPEQSSSRAAASSRRRTRC